MNWKKETEKKRNTLPFNEQSVCCHKKWNGGEDMQKEEERSGWKRERKQKEGCVGEGCLYFGDVVVVVGRVCWWCGGVGCGRENVVREGCFCWREEENNTKKNNQTTNNKQPKTKQITQREVIQVQKQTNERQSNQNNKHSERCCFYFLVPLRRSLKNLPP